MSAAHEALSQSHSVADYQAVGVRCRETLLSFTAIAQAALPWTSDQERPKGSDFRGWIEHVCLSILGGATNKYRRQLLKTQADAAWIFVNWLTHASSSTWHDAEAAVDATEHTISLCVSAVTLHIRGVPSACPECGDHRLTPLRAEHPDDPDEVWERPFCQACKWMGTPAKITKDPVPIFKREGTADQGPCITPNVPLRQLRRPRDDE